MRERNTIFIHNRYFRIYCDFEEIENDFRVPVFRTRIVLKLKERYPKKSVLSFKSCIRILKIFKTPMDIESYYQS
ncbi:MAG TPA: DUF1246 domain-containing protein [Methanomicrobia archaeon]|nr:DUF1246 domain-containing protein [Methanomicrobia archaeon]